MANLDRGNLKQIIPLLSRIITKTSEMTESSSSVSLYPRLSFANYDMDDTEPCEFVRGYKCPLEPHKGGLRRNRINIGLPHNYEATATHIKE